MVKDFTTGPIIYCVKDTGALPYSWRRSQSRENKLVPGPWGRALELEKAFQEVWPDC